MCPSDFDAKLNMWNHLNPKIYFIINRQEGARGLGGDSLPTFSGWFSQNCYIYRVRYIYFMQKNGKSVKLKQCDN